MKKIWIGFWALVCVFALCSCGNDYEKTAKSAYDKFSKGDFDSMTPAEKAHIDGFLDWLNDK